MMENLALRYPHLETGGDLFGLWTNEGDAVIHVLLGPPLPTKSRRSAVSSYRPVGRGGGVRWVRPHPPPQTAEVHFFVKKINSKKK